MAQDDTKTQKDTPDTPQGAVTVGEEAQSLFDPDLDARAKATRVFETRTYEGEALRYGQMLRRVREMLGLDLKDIARESRIREHYLMAIERMEIGPIPKGYLTVYLRTYAGYLGLPADEVVAGYTRECGAAEEIKDTAPVQKISEIEDKADRRPLYVAAAAVLAIAVGAATFLFTGSDQSALPPTAAPVAAINGANDSLFSEVDVPEPLVNRVPLELVAVKQGWMEVRGADGTIFRSRVMAEGETYFPRLDAGWTVSARDGSAFEWRVGDLVIGPLGPEATPVFSISVDQQLARAAEIAAPAVADTGGQPVNP